MQSEDLSNQQAAVVFEVCEQLQMQSSVHAHMLVEMTAEKISLFPSFFFFFSLLIIYRNNVSEFHFCFLF